MAKTDALSAGAVTFLLEGHIAHFVTLMPDGSPQATAVWVDSDRDGRHVLVNCRHDRIKVNNARRDPRVVVSVIDPSNWRRYTIVRGRVVELRTAGAEEHYQQLEQRYVGKSSSQPPDGRIVLYIKPDYVLEREV